MTLGTTGYRGDLIEYSSKYTGIDEIGKNNFSISYNHSSKEFVFSSSDVRGEYAVSIYNSAGSLISKFQTETNYGKSKPIWIASGIYVYTLESKLGQKVCGKFSVMD